jgi:nucleotide-binding universal stress UspA family protein
MPKFILVPSADATADPPVLETALAAARVSNSHLMLLYVRPDVHEQIASMAATEVRAVSGVGERLERLERQTDTKEQAAEQSWRSFCHREELSIANRPGSPGITSEWLSVVGSDIEWLVRFGRTADLIVVGRARSDGGIAMDRLESALMATGRPVLIAPAIPPASLATNVGIAWKDTREAACAVTGASAFIDQARQVTIYTVEETDHEEPGPELLARALRWRNPNVTIRRLRRERRPPEQVLLQAAADAGTDLIVMGGYGHARLRQAVFGGFTRYMLEKAELPILLAH